MRIRTLKPEFWTNPKIGRLKRDERLLFIGLLNLADDQGVLIRDASFIKAQLLGYDKDLRETAVEAWLTSLKNARLIVPFEYRTEGYYVIRSFSKHQVINKPSKPKFPEELIEKILQEEEEKHYGSTTVVVTEDYLPERKGKEGKGKEGNNTILAKNFENFSPEAIGFADWFVTLLPEGQKYTEKDKENWSQTYDEMIRIDKREKSLIVKVVKWARNDEFWATNFLSASKLRKKDKNGVQFFDVFRIKMESEYANASTSNQTPSSKQQSNRVVWNEQSHREYGEVLDYNKERIKAKFRADNSNNNEGGTSRDNNRLGDGSGEEITLLRSLSVITAAQIEAFSMYLVSDMTYDREKMKTAERWCKEGDWNWKGPAQFMTLQDFYPTKEQLESLNRRGDYIILSRNELASKIRKAKEQAVRDYEASLPSPKPLDEKEKELNDAWIELYNQRAKTKDEVTQLTVKLNRMERRNKELEERNAELYKEVVWYRKSEEERLQAYAAETQDLIQTMKEKNVKPDFSKMTTAEGVKSMRQLLKDIKL